MATGGLATPHRLLPAWFTGLRVPNGIAPTVQLSPLFQSRPMHRWLQGSAYEPPDFRFGRCFPIGANRRFKVGWATINARNPASQGLSG